MQDTCPVATRAWWAAPWGRAPTNVRPRVFLDADETRVDPASIVLHQDDAVVPTDARILRSEKLVVVELRPAQPLAPGTPYQVLGNEGDRTVRLLGFETTDGPDTRSPVWAGVTKTTVVAAPARPSSCHTGGLYALLDIARPEGDARDLAFAVWVAGDSRIDPDAPSFIVDAWEGRRLIIGGGLSPFPRNLRLPETGAVRLVVAAIDPSGNRSVPVEVTLDMGAALPEHPPWTDEWIVTARRMESLRRAGETDVHLPTTSIEELKRAGYAGERVVLRVCVSPAGDVDEVKMLNPDPARLTPAFVDHYRRAIGAWKFWPLEVAGQPARMCAFPTYNYVLRR